MPRTLLMPIDPGPRGAAGRCPCGLSPRWMAPVRGGSGVNMDLKLVCGRGQSSAASRRQCEGIPSQGAGVGSDKAGNTHKSSRTRRKRWKSSGMALRRHQERRCTRRPAEEEGKRRLGQKVEV
jgi:hypothetical protein